MEVKRQTLIASLTISIILLSISTIGDAQLEGIIDEICKQSFNYDFCSSTLHQDLPDGKPETIMSLNMLTKLQALTNVTNTLGFVRTSIPKERDSQVLERLRICEHGYSNVEENMKQSFMAFNRQDYWLMKRYETSAIVEQQGCYEYFYEAPFNTHPVHQMSDQIRILITMDRAAGSYLR